VELDTATSEVNGDNGNSITTTQRWRRKWRADKRFDWLLDHTAVSVRREPLCDGAGVLVAYTEW